MRALRHEIVDIKSRQADMNKKVQSDMTTVKNLLYQIASYHVGAPVEHGEWRLLPRRRTGRAR